MAWWSKQTKSPIDRAVEDVERQIAALEQQMRTIGAGDAQTAPAADLPAESVKKFLMEMLTPPAKKTAGSSYKSRHDLFDGAAEPLKDLEAEPISFAQQPEPDLFAGAATAQKIDCAPKPEEKLAIYISAGSFRSFRKPLRLEQRRNRNRFFMWLGLSFVALWFIWAVVR